MAKTPSKRRRSPASRAPKAPAFSRFPWVSFLLALAVFGAIAVAAFYRQEVKQLEQKVEDQRLEILILRGGEEEK